MRAKPLLAAVLLFVLSLAAGAAEGYRPAPEEQALLDLLDKQQRPLEAREAARAYLADHPGSFVACLVAGTVYLQAEGDLPRAYYYLKRSRTLLEKAYGEEWVDGNPWRTYARTLWMLHLTCQRMERYQETLEILETHDRFFTPKRPAHYAWSYMKLGREAAAREKIAEALASKDPEDVEMALNSLGALESEADHPDEGYDAFTRLYALNHRPGRPVECTFVRNRAEAAYKLHRFEEAEKLYLESTHLFQPESESNPWQDLALIYLDEGRYPEAVDAVKRMQDWAYRSLPLIGLDNWNFRQTITAGLLLSCGYTEEALSLSRRLVDRPDRHGYGSAQADQWEAASLLFYDQVLQDALARDAEALSYAPWKERPGLWLRRAAHILEARAAGRRAGRIVMGGGDRLAHSLRIFAPRSAILVPGGEVLLPRVVGTGVAEAQIQRLLARRGAMAERERPYLLYLLGAGRAEEGDARGALESLGQAEKTLPAEHAQMVATLHALKAQAYAARGERGAALRELAVVMEKDAGAVRRQGLSLPCTLQASGGAAARAAARLLAASPRLDTGGTGFTVVVEQTGAGGLQGGLDGPGGAVLCRFRVNPGASPDATAREFCRLFHRKAFGPRIDLSQQEINSLEGSTLAADSLQDRLKGLLGDAPADAPADAGP